MLAYGDENWGNKNGEFFEKGELKMEIKRKIIMRGTGSDSQGKCESHRSETNNIHDE